MDIFLILIAGVILTAVTYMVFPLIKLTINGKKFEDSRAHKIALWNSIVVGIIYFFATTLLSDSSDIWNCTPAVCYYYLNLSILSEPTKSKNSCAGFSMKWYNFFTKVRPWLTIVITALLLLGSKDTLLPLLDINNVGATLLLFNWIYVLASLGSVVLQMMLFFKAKNSSPDLLNFIEITLVFDFLFSTYAYIILEYQMGVSFGTIAVVVLALVAFEYFIWYKCNMDYFWKRLCASPAKPSNMEKAAPKVTISPQVQIEPSPPTRSVATGPVSVSDKVANYAIISNSLAVGFLEHSRQKIKLQIETVTTEYPLVRKTDLMKIIFGNISQLFADAQGSRTDLVVGAYYQVAFDEMLAYFEDQTDLMLHYSLSKSTGTVDSTIHKYLQMIVRIQLIIDDVISSSKHCDTFHGYSKHLQTKIFDELNAYIDDKTDWNKL